MSVSLTFVIPGKTGIQEICVSPDFGGRRNTALEVFTNGLLGRFSVQ
jgi:hypothetical protein